MMSSQSPAPVRPIDKAGRHLPSFILFLSLTLGVAGLDLLVKHLSFKHVAGRPVELERDAIEHADDQHRIPPHSPRTLVPHVLSLRLTTNTGAVFGLGKGSQSFFVIVSIVAIVAIGRVFYASPRAAKLLHVCLALILAGALGNLYDRIRYSAVRDMLYLFPGVPLPFGLNWPNGSDELYPWIFNIADVSLVAGVGLLLVLMWRGEPKPTPEAAVQKGPR